jgi:hypothetical protein
MLLQCWVTDKSNYCASNDSVIRISVSSLGSPRTLSAVPTYARQKLATVALRSLRTRVVGNMGRVRSLVPWWMATPMDASAWSPQPRRSCLLPSPATRFHSFRYRKVVHRISISGIKNGAVVSFGYSRLVRWTRLVCGEKLSAYGNTRPIHLWVSVSFLKEEVAGSDARS